MITSDIPIYLASKSPRRRKLLRQLGLKFKSFSVDLDEEILDGEHPIKTVKRLAKDKLKLAIERKREGIFITADTIVVLNKEVIGKPKNKKDAVKILKKLSGNTHFVYTGYAIYNSMNKREIVNYRRSAVTFRKLSHREITEYVEGGSPMDKAGAYGIQDDFGAVFVKEIKGCYYNVMGLPLSDVYLALKEIL